MNEKEELLENLKKDLCAQKEYIQRLECALREARGYVVAYAKSNIEAEVAMERINSILSEK